MRVVGPFVTFVSFVLFLSRWHHPRPHAAICYTFLDEKKTVLLYSTQDPPSQNGHSPGQKYELQKRRRVHRFVASSVPIGTSDLAIFATQHLYYPSSPRKGENVWFPASVSISSHLGSGKHEYRDLAFGER